MQEKLKNIQSSSHRHFNCMNEYCGKRLDEEDLRYDAEKGRITWEGKEYHTKIPIVVCKTCRQNTKEYVPTCKKQVMV